MSASVQSRGGALPLAAEAPAQRDLALGFALHVEAWARAGGAPAEVLPALRDAALRLTLASAQGHVCLPLATLIEESENPAEAGGAEAVASLRAKLLASGVVAEAAPALPAGAHPLVLDGGDRLYLRRHFDLENRLAGRLRGLARPAALADAAALRERVGALLDKLFPPRDDGLPDGQKLAVAQALLSRLMVISGGPGTGKTTTVAALLGCLLTVEPALRIALAAPTGKAAARMLEALRARAAGLPPRLRGKLPEAAHTVHRLLGVTPEPGRFRHHAGNPLAVDVLVVDEASMLDLALAARLFDAVPSGARVILLGDKDQLAAVEAGAVFADLSARRLLRPTTAAALETLAGMAAEAPLAAGSGPVPALADCVAWLSESRRFSRDSGIGRLAADINQGEGERALLWLRANEDDAVRWLEDAATQPAAATLARLEAGYVPYLETLKQTLAGEADVTALFAAFDRFRVLAALHEGPRGLAALNAHLARWLRAALGGHAQDRGAASPWYPGRPVIVLRNDGLLGLYNGDVGLCLPDADGALAVHFPAAGGGFRSVAPLRLPAHDTAFALTVHKSQGSEFEEVALLLPARPSPVLSRELLYTGVTRAARKLQLMGAGPVFAAACAQPTRRWSGLAARLEEQGASS